MCECSLPGRRINVVGTTGSGKTTVARALASRLAIPHIEMDGLFWKPGWTETSDEELFAAVDRATDGPSWVLDGNYSRTRPIVWPKLDTVVWLDYAFSRVFGQLLRRTIRRAITREPLWGGCCESARKAFFSRDSILLWCISTYRRRRRKYPRLFADPENAHLHVIRLRSPRQAARWLQSIAPSAREA
jgi:adenylate kinase family enzyme